MSGTSGFKGSGITDPFQTPDAPTVDSVSAGVLSASVSFTAPTETGGGAITSYVASAKQSDGASVSGTGTSSPIDITLTAGGTTTFAVQAFNTYGAGQFSGYGNSSTVYAGAEAYGWGYNFAGNIGDNTRVNASSPVQVGTDTNYTDIASGGTGTSAFTLAVRTDGSLWAWGDGGQGCTGLNTTLDRSSPVQVGALTNWSSVETGKRSAYAIKTDGTLWAWGSNDQGQLADGTIVNKSSPVQVGSETNWTQVQSGQAHVAAFTTDNDMYMWGSGGIGQLGIPTTKGTSRSSPVQVPGSWLTAGLGDSYSLAIKTDGGLYAFGSNSNSALGLNDNNIHRSSPTQIGALTTWEVAAGAKNSFCSAAIKTDGTLWTWAKNNAGNLGQNNRINRSSPVQVGSDTDWKTVAMDDDMGTGTKGNGELYMWGIGTIGQLGQNDVISRSSPVQVAGTGWLKSDVSGPNIAAAIKGV